MVSTLEEIKIFIGMKIFTFFKIGGKFSGQFWEVRHVLNEFKFKEKNSNNFFTLKIILSEFEI